MTLYNFMRFEPPSVRQNRLFETTRRLTGEVLELTELQTNMERFREVERQQRPQFPEPARQPGIPSFVEDVFRQVGRFAAPGAPDLALPENLGGVAPPTPNIIGEASARLQARQELMDQGLNAAQADHVIDSALRGQPVNEDELALRADRPGQLERVGGRALGIVSGGIGTANEALFQANKFLNEQLGTPIEQQPTREEVGLQPILETLESGRTLSRPVVDVATDVEAAPFRVVESAGVPVVSPAAGGTADVIQSQIVEDIGTEVINPVALLAVAPFAMVGTAGLRGSALAAQITSNLLATGLEPGLIRGTLRGISLLRLAARGGRAGLKITDAATARSAAASLREAGNVQAAEQLEKLALSFEGTEAIRGGRAFATEPTGTVLGEGAALPTTADVGGAAVRPITRAGELGDVTAPEFAQGAVRADTVGLGADVAPQGRISSQVLQPRPQTGPALLETRLPSGAQRALTGEAGFGPPRLAGDQTAFDITREVPLRPGPQGDVRTLNDDELLRAFDDSFRELVEETERGVTGDRLELLRRRANEINDETIRRGLTERAGISEFTQGEEFVDLGGVSLRGSETAATPPLRGGQDIPSTLRVEGGQIVGGSEAGGGTLAGLGEAKAGLGRLIDPFLPTGGIPGGFRLTPPGMKPGAKVTGLTQEGERIEGTLIQATGEKAIVRDAAGNVRPVTEAQLVEEAGAIGIGTRLRDLARDFRFGPSSRSAVPSLDPSVQKFVKVLRTAKPTQRTLGVERTEELGRRAAAGRVPFEAEARTPEEALAGLRGAQKGKLPEPPEFEVTLPSGEAGLAKDAFTQEEITNFINIARYSPALDRELFTRGNILESLMGRNVPGDEKLGILFGRLPTPGELKQLERVYGAEFARELQKLRPFDERFWRLTLDALNIPRSLLAAFDLSFPFRQGVFAFARHPKEFFGNLPAMLRAAKNPEFAEQMVAAIKADRTLIETAEGFRPLNELMEESRLFLPDVSGTEAFEARAEEFLSQLAERIPGVGFSKRGFIAYGDKLRADIFRNTLQSWARQSKPATAKEIADLGIMLNVLTGRGNLPPELARSLSFGFFAPRFASSRPQLFLTATVNNLPGVRKVTGTLLGAPGQTGRVTQLASQELATSVGAGLGILALVKMSGTGDVELDPRSSDFGKIRIGRTRIDFWGGARPWATAIARMITGQTKSGSGLIVPQSVLKTLGAFGRSKLAPPGAFLTDVIVGETAIGGEVGTTSDILNRTIPLAIQDFKDAIEQEGALAGLLSTAAFLGVGFQTYGSDLQDAYNRHVKAGDFGSNAPRYEDVETSIERRDNINKFDDLKKLSAELETPFALKRTERSAALLPNATALLEDGVEAARTYNKTRSNIMAVFAGANEEAFGDLDIKPRGRDGELLDEYYEVDFAADLNDNGLFGDEDDVQLAIKAQDRLRAKMSKPVQDALKNPENFFVDRAVIEIETMRVEAVDAIREITSKPKWKGLTVEEGDKVDDLVRQIEADVQRFKAKAVRESGRDPDLVTFRSVAAWLFEQGDITAKDANNAIAISSGKAIRAQERIDVALDNRRVLLTIFPDFFDSVLPVDVERQELTEQEINQLQPAGVDR